jgi:hypothetical protein
VRKTNLQRIERLGGQARSNVNDASPNSNINERRTQEHEVLVAALLSWMVLLCQLYDERVK